MVSDPALYKWSSYRNKVYGTHDPVVDLPLFYEALGKNEEERQTAYYNYVNDTIPVDELKLIRNAIQRGQAAGGDKFWQELSNRLGVKLSNKCRGRPRSIK